MFQATGNRRGILAMLISMALFTTNDALVKLVTAHHPTGQIMTLRGLVATLTVVAMAAWQGHLAMPRRTLNAGVAQRGLLEVISTACYITALTTLALPIVSAITQATPLIITVLCVLLGLEQVGWRRAIAVAVGFCGVLIILRPSAEGISWGALFALGAALTVSGRDLITRTIAADIPSTIVTLVSTAFTALFGLFLGLFETWQPLAWREMLYIVAAGLFLAFGNFAMVIACRGVDLSVVIPFRYSVIFWSLLAGYLIWGHVPDAIAIAGIVLIIASGLYTLHRERIRAREALQPSAN